MNNTVKSGLIIAGVVVAGYVNVAYGVIALLIILAIHMDAEIQKSAAQVTAYYIVMYAIQLILRTLSNSWSAFAGWLAGIIPGMQGNVYNIMMKANICGYANNIINLVMVALLVVMVVLALLKGKLSLPIVNKLAE